MLWILPHTSGLVGSPWERGQRGIHGLKSARIWANGNLWAVGLEESVWPVLASRCAREPRYCNHQRLDMSPLGQDGTDPHSTRLKWTNDGTADCRADVRFAPNPPQSLGLPYLRVVASVQCNIAVNGLNQVATPLLC